MKYKGLVLIEDGSVNLENVEQKLEAEGILSIVYRQGARPPELVDLQAGIVEEEEEC